MFEYDLGIFFRLKILNHFIISLKVLDSVVRIEQATGEPANILVTHNPDGTTSIEASAADPLIVKDEKNAAKIETAQFAIPAEIKDIKGLDLKVCIGLYVILYRDIASPSHSSDTL